MPRTKKSRGDENLLICRCCEVSEAEILDAIAHGADNVDAVKRATRAGMGLCQGRSCSHLVAQLLRRHAKKDPAEITPATVRPPIRPIPAKLLAKLRATEKGT